MKAIVVLKFVVIVLVLFASLSCNVKTLNRSVTTPDQTSTLDGLTVLGVGLLVVGVAFSISIRKIDLSGK